MTHINQQIVFFAASKMGLSVSSFFSALIMTKKYLRTSEVLIS